MGPSTSLAGVVPLQPDPRQQPINTIYNFSTWSRQLRDFTAGVIGEPATLVCNSVGGLAGLQVRAGPGWDALVRATWLELGLAWLEVSRQDPR